MKSARREAFDTLFQIFKNRAYSNLILDHGLSKSMLPERDRAFAARLVYGTVERMLSLDYILSCYLSQPVDRLKLQVLVNLRLGVYQLYFMDKVPASAVINEAVQLAKETGCAFAAGLVNAVLRKVAVHTIDLSQLEPSLRYSCPVHLIRMWTKMYGEENTLGLLKSINQPAPMTIRVNSLKTGAGALAASFLADQVEATPARLKNAMHLEHVGGVASLKQFEDGLFHVQDLASQLCIEALDPQPGETVFDLCAAPGGKSFTIAQEMMNQGTVYAFDLYQRRLDLIKKGAGRLGITNLKTTVSDASIYNEALPMADRVLCDVPCSGLGIIRRKPEIRYKELDSVKDLPTVQLSILENASRYVKPGGTLVYSTCALNKKENDQVADAFLKEHPAYRAVSFLPKEIRGVSDSPYLTLFPHINGTDGFFIAKFEREGTA